MYFDTQSSKASYPNANPLQDCRKYILNGIVESFLISDVTEAPPLLVFQRHLSTEEEPTRAPLRETNQSQAVSVLQPAQLKKKNEYKILAGRRPPSGSTVTVSHEKHKSQRRLRPLCGARRDVGLDPLPVRWEPRPHPRQIGPIIGLPSTSTASQISPNKS